MKWFMVLLILFAFSGCTPEEWDKKFKDHEHVGYIQLYSHDMQYIPKWVEVIKVEQHKDAHNRVLVHFKRKGAEDE